MSSLNWITRIRNQPKCGLVSPGCQKKEIDNRVRLAHHSISQEDVDPGEELRAIQAFLRPHTLDHRKKWTKAKSLTMMEIVDFTGRVNDIHEKLIALLELMKKRKSLR